MAKPAPRLIVGALYEGALSLDLIGPMEAFNYASLELGGGGYKLMMAAAKPGPVATLSGVRLMAEIAFCDLENVDTLLIPGARSGDERVRRSGLIEHLRAHPNPARRIASVCSGALVCAEAGLLKGKRVTTHWMDSEALREFEDVEVDIDCIFVRDGNTYSSGGVTAGVDLALAIIEEDHGRPLALKVARRMIVYLKRQGGQAQFSDALGAQTVACRFAELVDWIEANLTAAVTIDSLAAREGMSPRNFARRFQEELGLSPMAYVTARRLEFAKRLIEESGTPFQTIATQSGLESEERLRRAFQRAFAVSPADYRRRFGPASG